MCIYMYTHRIQFEISAALALISLQNLSNQTIIGFVIQKQHT